MLRFASINTGIEAHLKAVGQQLRPHHRYGKGFTVLRGLLAHKRILHFYPVLQKICCYTLAVHNYVEGTSEAQTLGLMADERNYVQHCLMSLGIDRELGETGPQFSAYNICRLSTTIYALLVVFPLPPLAAPFARLGKELSDELTALAQNELWTRAPQLLSWIIVMGAIASVGSDLRSWYVSILIRYTRQLEIESWAGLKECLQDFLWFENTSDVDGADLWKEAQLGLAPDIQRYGSNLFRGHHDQ
jgi:hypothetical protein